mgnify:CR=1 FL=1
MKLHLKYIVTLRHHGFGLHLRISDLLARGALSVSGKGG